MGVWTICYFDVKTCGNKYQTFDFIEDLQVFLEDYEIEVKKKFPLNNLEDTVIVFPPKTDVRATDILKGKYDFIRF